MSKQSNRRTKLKEHTFKNKKLVPPLANVPLTPSSWINDRLPEMLWAVLLTVKYSRDDRLLRFIEIVEIACSLTNKIKFDLRINMLPVTHTGMAKLDYKDKVVLMKAIAKDDEARDALKPMLFYDKLPDKDIWESIIETPPKKRHWNELAHAVSNNFFHQSPEATDCRWVKAYYAVKSGLVQFTQKTQEFPKLILNYPNHTEEELTSSRGAIRALEISLDINLKDKSWPKEFWKASFEMTDCIVDTVDFSELEKRFPTNSQIVEDKKKLSEIQQNLTNNFWKTLKDTDLNARHEVCFGLGMYAADLATSSILLGLNRTSQARMVLRSLVECLITLKYLIVNDDKRLWETFKEHGTGQAKLVLQRSEEEDRIPNYLDPKNLDQIANDDIWVEFLTIDVGSWDDSNLRSMAINIGLKDKYDDYYIWPSSYSHSQWGAVRETVYDLCGNPLHRFHRVPRLVPMNLKDANNDIYLLLDEILALVYELYPSK